MQDSCALLVSRGVATVVLVALVAITAPTRVVAVPGGTTEYSTVQIANQEWDPEESFGNSQANLQLGVEANKANTFQDIGFGYVGNALQYKPPAVIAYEQTSSDGETKGDLVFGTRSSTSGGASATQQMRLRSDGTVEVDGNLQVDSTSVFNERVSMFYGLEVGEYLEVTGTLSASGAAVLSDSLAVGGTLADTSHALYVTGSIYATTTNTASDSRFKRDVEPIGGALGVLRSLRPVTFNFRTEDFPHKKFPDAMQAGVIAQEMETVLPHLVSSDDAGYKAVAYDRLGVYALAGVKELDAKDAVREEVLAAQKEMIAAQGEKLTALEEQVKALAAAVEALKSQQQPQQQQQQQHGGGGD